MKLSISDRGEGATKIKSRLESVSTNAQPISDYESIKVLLDQRIKNNQKPDVIVIDESQFLSTKQVEELHDIAHLRNIPVLAYTLKTTFKREFFEGSKRLFELGDDFEEIIGLCWCGKRAKFNARVQDGRIVEEGSDVLVGDTMYIALCPKHFSQGKIEGE